MSNLDPINFSVLLERRRVAAGQRTSLYGAVMLQAPRYSPAQRPPLDLVACIDVSGSMSGDKIRSVRRAVQQLVGNLEPQDRLALVSFSNEARLVSPLMAVHEEGRRALLDRIAAFEADGSTDMSAGTELSLEQLREPPRSVEGREVVRRVMVFTDGHANMGLRERDTAGWVRLLRSHLEGASVSWFGFGEDHDPQFLGMLADESRGNAYRAADADAIGTAFAQELGSLIGIVARDLTIRLRGRHDVVTVLNDDRTERAGDAVVVHLPDLTSQERRPICFAVPVAEGPLGEERTLVDVEIAWTDARTQAPGRTTLVAAVSFVREAEASPRDTTVLEEVAELRGANAQRQAANLVEAGDTARARELLQEVARFAAGIGTARGTVLARRFEELAESYADRDRYMSSKSELFSSMRSMSRKRASGSRFDDEKSSDLQRVMAARFVRGEPPRSEE